MCTAAPNGALPGAAPLVVLAAKGQITRMRAACKSLVTRSPVMRWFNGGTQKRQFALLPSLPFSSWLGHSGSATSICCGLNSHAIGRFRAAYCQYTDVL